MGKLEEKVAVVTGAGRGIGRAIAERLAAEGAALVINYARSEGEARALVAELEAKGGRALAVRADVARLADVRALFAAADAHFGRLDVLVNNAGVARSAALAEVTEAELDEVFAVNVKGTLFAAQEAAKRLGQGGRIINVSSTVVDHPMPGLTAYGGSKAVARLFTEVWARELGPRGITVNTVVPGPTTPGMFDGAPAHLREGAAKASPLGRIGRADEVASVVAFLCSDDASWVTGQHLVVNGGASV